MKYWKTKMVLAFCCIIILSGILLPFLNRPYRSNERLKPEKLIEIQIEKSILNFLQYHDDKPLSLNELFPEYLGAEVTINHAICKAYYFSLYCENRKENWSLVIIYPNGQPDNFIITYNPDGKVDVIKLEQVTCLNNNSPTSEERRFFANPAESKK